jgi:hypothetical protein
MRQGWKKRAGLSLALFASALLLAATLGGPVACGAVFVLGLLVFAWWNDNDLGYCLPLAMLFLLALGIVLMAFVMAIKVHG